VAGACDDGEVAVKGGSDGDCGMDEGDGAFVRDMMSRGNELCENDAMLLRECVS
jgi:hypothetical protein